MWTHAAPEHRCEHLQWLRQDVGNHQIEAPIRCGALAEKVFLGRDTLHPMVEPIGLGIGLGHPHGDGVDIKGDDLLITGGTISLQSESHPIDFRKVEIMVLED